MERARGRRQAAEAQEGRALTFPRRTRESVAGWEFDWIALDAAGQIALLSTAGGGFVPEAVLAGAGDYDDVIDEVLRMPAYRELAYAPQLAAHLENTWALAATRGLFAYDADFNGGPYRRVAGPESAITVDALPRSVALVAGRVVLRGSFDTLTSIDSSILRAASTTFP